MAMRMIGATGFGMIGLVSAVVASSALAAPPFAAAAKSGKTLVVPSELADTGTVYYALTGRDRQVYFESDAPLEKIKGQSNRVIGFAVAGPESSPAALPGGEWHLPVESMKTGIALRDEHLASSAWFDAEAYPDIVFQLTEVEDIEPGKSGPGYTSYKATLVGDITLHGVTRPIRIEGATITFLAASDKTARIAKGDLLAIRTKYSVTLSDHEVSHPQIGKKVADEVAITTTLYLSTVPPSMQ